LQRNFGIKALVLAQQHGLRQLHFYQAGEAVPAPPAGVPVSAENEFKLMGLYEDLNRDPPGRQKLTELGQAVRTTAHLLGGLPYSAAATAALHLPAEVGGGAFTDGRRIVYVLWARTPLDQSEAASATYSLPAGPGAAQVQPYAWNYQPGATPPPPMAAQNLALTGTPTFFVPIGQPAGRALALRAAPKTRSK
jgi:hypothetical protein